MNQDLGYRTIQGTGRDSYIISLPKEWILKSELKKGSQLAFKVQEDSSLLLVPRKVLEKHEERKLALKEHSVEITRKEEPQSIARRIRALYAVSAELIHIRFREGEITFEQKISIKNTVKTLLGSEIVAESPDEIDIRILIDHPAFPIDQAIRRMLAIAISMDKDAVSALKNFDEDLTQGVISSDDELDRLSLYVTRQLKYGVEHNMFNEMGFRSPKEFLGYRIVVKNIENVGDNAVSTAKNLLSFKKLIDADVLALIKPIDEEVYSSTLRFHSFTHDLLEDSLKALFGRNYRLADGTISRFMSTGLQLENDAINLLMSKRLEPHIAAVIRLILSNSRKMMEYARDIAEVTLNRTVEEISSS